MGELALQFLYFSLEGMGGDVIVLREAKSLITEGTDS